LRLAITILISLLLAPYAFSQNKFVQTGRFFQSSDGTSKVIPSDLGIFFFIPSKAISLQKFSESDLTIGQSLFLEFNAQSNSYTHLHLGHKKLEIRGSFALSFGQGKLMINIDNYPNPYCSVVLGDSSDKPSLIAFNGVTPVLQYEGREAVALLRANQSLSNISDIKPYEVGADSNTMFIKLSGEEVKFNHIGLDIPPPKNLCLAQLSKEISVTYVESSEIRKIKSLPDSTEKKQRLTELLKNKEKSLKLITSLVILKITSNNIIAFNPDKGTIQVIHLRSQNPTVCEVKDVELG
jgi:hypothetical protein